MSETMSGGAYFLLLLLVVAVGYYESRYYATKAELDRLKEQELRRPGKRE